MSVSAELNRLKSGMQSLTEEIRLSTGARAKAPLSPADRRALRAEMQALIQMLDELAGKLSG